METKDSSAIFPLICDVCGGPIDKSMGGTLEWLRTESDDKYVKGSMRMICNYRCGYSYTGFQGKSLAAQGCDLSDRGLTNFMGASGMSRLFEVASWREREFDIDDLGITLLRLNMPGYDRAWHHIDEALSRGIIEHDFKIPFLDQTGVDEINAWLDSEGR